MQLLLCHIKQQHILTKPISIAKPEAISSFPSKIEKKILLNAAEETGNYAAVMSEVALQQAPMEQAQASNSILKEEEKRVKEGISLAQHYTRVASSMAVILIVLIFSATTKD